LASEASKAVAEVSQPHKTTRLATGHHQEHSYA
jgi:hypothetical protein